jgi:protein-S-isoprenylcysteine O-methyltransferase Ste14
MLPGWLRWVGLVPMVPAAALLVDSWMRFVIRGRGTPAPIAPPQRLVVSGFYRWVRNPMYVAIILVLVGEALLFRSSTLLGYAALLWLVFHIFVTLYEEPHLETTFGDSYTEYRRSVPRWVPRRPSSRPEETSGTGSLRW